MLHAASGALVHVLGQAGSGRGEFRGPTSVAVSECDAFLFVAGALTLSQISWCVHVDLDSLQYVSSWKGQIAKINESKLCELLLASS